MSAAGTASAGRPAPSLLQTLIDGPARFGLDAAVAVMMRAARTGDPGEAARFHAAAELGFAASDVAAVERGETGFHATLGLLGLTGPSGVLPRPYTEIVNAEQRRRSPRSWTSSRNGRSRNSSRRA